MQIPYDELTLRIAGLSLGKKFEEIPDFQERLSKIVDESNLKVDKPVAVAEYHHITPLELANSPNREKLIEEFEYSLVKKLIDALQGIGLTDKEAWAFFAMGVGKLN